MGKHAALILSMLCCLLAATRAYGQSETWWDSPETAAIKRLMEEGSMDKWRGDVPMSTIDDIMDYLDTFREWGCMVYGKPNADINGMPEFEFKKQVISIQTEAFPKLREAFGLVLAGIEPDYHNEILVETSARDSRTLDFIWTGIFSPHPDFIQDVKTRWQPLWEDLRYSSVSFYRMSSTGRIKMDSVRYYTYQYEIRKGEYKSGNRDLIVFKCQ